MPGVKTVRQGFRSVLRGLEIIRCYGPLRPRQQKPQRRPMEERIEAAAGGGRGGGRDRINVVVFAPSNGKGRVPSVSADGAVESEYGVRVGK